jgi:hypothetical protein
LNFEHSDKVKALARQVQAFMDEHVCQIARLELREH